MTQQGIRGFYIGGSNGSFVQVEDGRYADTVSRETNIEGLSVQEALDHLNNEITIWVSVDEMASWGYWDQDVLDIRKYVCA